MKKLINLLPASALGLMISFFSLLSEIGKWVKKISIRTLVICQMALIIIAMYSFFNIIGHNTSALVVLIGIFSINTTLLVAFLLIKKPSAEWQCDWFFGTN